MELVPLLQHQLPLLLRAFHKIFHKCFCVSLFAFLRSDTDNHPTKQASLFLLVFDRTTKAAFLLYPKWFKSTTVHREWVLIVIDISALQVILQTRRRCLLLLKNEHICKDCCFLLDPSACWNLNEQIDNKVFVSFFCPIECIFVACVQIMLLF